MANKLSAIKNLPQPQTGDKVWPFLGLGGCYWPLIHCFAKTALPLLQLLNEEVPFHRNAPQDRSLTDLKSVFINAPALAVPDLTSFLPFFANASALELGAVLM